MSTVRTSSGTGDDERTLSRWRTRLLDYIDGHARDIVADLADLVRVPSICGSDAENEIQFRLATRLRTFGLDVDHWKIPLTEMLCEADFPGVEVDRLESWGTVGKLAGDGSGPSLMLNAHVDVVPPGDLAAWGDPDPFEGYVDAEAVHGRGACDMKGGLVASLWVMRAICELRVPLRGDLLLATVVGEEDGGLGTYAMLQRGWRADGCVIPEPTSLDIAPGSCGSLTFRLTIRGAATHASRRSSGVSAIEKSSPSSRRCAASRPNGTRPSIPLATRWDIPIPIELGIVQSGDWASSVPDLLTADGRLGVAIGEDVAEAKQALETALDKLAESDPWLRNHPVEISWSGGQFAPGLTDPDASVISAVRRAHQQVSAHAQDTWVTTYGSDLRLMRNIGEVPTVHCGPGDASLAHAPREHVPIDEVLTATRALTLTALEHCGVR